MPYKFNGKLEQQGNPDYSGELDQETGLYYYGARYYDPQISMWYGVDQMADKYPMLSPYMYTAGNPVILVDPDGQIFIHYTKVKGSDGKNVKVKITYDGKVIRMTNKKTGKSMNYTGQSQFVNDMITSYNYIVKNNADVDNAMKQIAKSKIEVEVIEKKKGGSYLDKKIEFDFNYGLKVFDTKGVNDKELGNQSPALGFWSEVYHAYIDLIDTKAKQAIGGDRQKEEDYVHIEKEHQVIDKLGGKETKRTQYEPGDAWPVKTKSVTSPEEKD